jgi:hypothetical protein
MVMLAPLIHATQKLEDVNISKDLPEHLMHVQSQNVIQKEEFFTYQEDVTMVSVVQLIVVTNIVVVFTNQYILIVMIIILAQLIHVQAQKDASTKK